MRRAVAMAALALGCALALPATARALTLRYALIVANDEGRDAAAPELPPLRHAEREAQRLRDALVDVAGFDASPRRTRLLAGATRAAVLEAAAALAEQRRLDREEIGEARTLFVFFFTGHGMDGRLLLADGALHGEELGRIFVDMQAELALGVFDACYSGSLEASLLASKGIRPAANVITTLPEPVVNAAGSVWFVSSGPDELSFEDPEVGGVFTHYFVEGLRAAERDGPAITLDRLWSYVSRETRAHTEARGRVQTPKKVVQRLSQSGKLYFSFPEPRSAALVLDAEVSGRLLLSYAQGQFVEVIEKPAGERRRYPVHAGAATLTLVERGQARVQRSVELEPGAALVVSSAEEVPTERALGRGERRLDVKGMPGSSLAIAVVDRDLTLQVGTGYALRAGGYALALPRHQVALQLRADHGALSAELHPFYGADARGYSAWGYRLHAAGGEVRAGYGFEPASAVRVTASAGVGMATVWQRFDDGGEARTWGAWPGGWLDVRYPADGTWSVALSGGAGAAYARADAEAASKEWTPWFGGGAALLWRVR